MQAAILPKDFDHLRGLITRVRELSLSLDEAISHGPNLEQTVRPARDELPQSQVLHYAKEIYAFRRKRNNWLPQDLFGEPAWDILLELFIMRMQGKSARVKTACLASGVPPTTALRWLNILERKGLIRSSSDSVDHRVRWVWLEDEPFDKFYAMLAEQIGLSVTAALPLPGSELACDSDGGSTR